jgi:murein DD-endopeptidase MepM/ murein hydrolase activator NlpD
VYHKPQNHTGVDLAGPSAIVAPADGVVVQVADRQGYGLTTVIDHGDGTGTVYGHQSAVQVRAGDRVVRGQRIGTVGHSGYATGPHLHFEVRVHGVPTDPTLWL